MNVLIRDFLVPNAQKNPKTQGKPKDISKFYQFIRTLPRFRPKLTERLDAASLGLEALELDST